MRRVNEATVLDVLYRGDAMTLSAITSVTGLSRRTVEIIVLDLEAQGWIRVRPAETAGGHRGRPARLFEFRPEAGAVLAVDIAHDHVTATVADLHGVAVASETIPVPGEPSRVDRLVIVRDAIQRALDRTSVTSSDLTAVTLATPGNVNDDGMVDVRLSMRGWTGFSLADEFADDFTCPVLVENDAKLAVRGELWRGSTTGADHVVWLMLAGPHHGLGIAVDGLPYRGVNGAAGETTWATTLGFDRLAELADLDPAERMAFAERARAGDPATVQTLDVLAAAVADGLSSLAWVLAPRHVVLGGSTSTALGDLLLDRVRTGFGASGPDFADVRLSSLGEAAVSVGAIRRALDEVERTLFASLRMSSGDRTAGSDAS
jgi:predicted NBD/HSP70 family sugar kinase